MKPLNSRLCLAIAGCAVATPESSLLVDGTRAALKGSKKDGTWTVPSIEY